MASVSAVPTPEPPFDPYDLRPLASLNRRQFIHLPGIDPAWAGKTGWELCSTQALVRLIQARAAELGLETAAIASSLVDLPRRLSDLLDSTDLAIRAVARGIAETHGRRLGGLVASIFLSPDGLTSPLEPWEAAYLSHWRQEVQQIFLGGGLANGRLGKTIAGAAEAMLRDCGLRHLSVRAAPDPSYLPLIGAARRLPAGEWRVSAVADFGSTWAKRALAFYRPGGELEKLVVLPPVSTAGLVEPGKAGLLASAMVSVLADTIQQAGRSFAESNRERSPAGAGRLRGLAPDLVCSLAAYVIDGQPAPPVGTPPAGYYGLHAVSSDLRDWFSEQVSRASGQPVRLQFAHDAEAAAAALAWEMKAAVIMLGSALGVGFVPPTSGLRPVSSNFTLISWE